MRFARGTPWVFIAANAGVVLFAWGAAVEASMAADTPARSAGRLILTIVGALGLLWLGMLLAFFRDPDRTPGQGVVSPADGKVREAFAQGQKARVSIFLGVLDVHVIRAPFDGRIESMEARAGGRRFAFSKESELNQRLIVHLAGVGPWRGVSARLTLIGGAFADRIEPYVGAGANLACGERLGIIKFGSRVDLELEGAAFALKVSERNTVKAAQTSLMTREA